MGSYGGGIHTKWSRKVLLKRGQNNEGARQTPEGESFPGTGGKQVQRGGTGHDGETAGRE